MTTAARRSSPSAPKASWSEWRATAATRSRTRPRSRSWWRTDGRAEGLGRILLRRSSRPRREPGHHHGSARTSWPTISGCCAWSAGWAWSSERSLDQGVVTVRFTRRRPDFAASGTTDGRQSAGGAGWSSGGDPGGPSRDGGGAAGALRPGARRARRLRGLGPADRPGPDDLPAVRRRAHDRGAGARRPRTACSRSARAPGYAAAVLAELVGEVYTVERLETLAAAARARLASSATGTSTSCRVTARWAGPSRRPTTGSS